MNDIGSDEELGFIEAENINVEVEIRGRKLPSGHKMGIYHNPNTGQELRLPADNFSMEHYTMRHRLMHDPKKVGAEAFGVRLVFGPAPADLKAKWEEGKDRFVDVGTAKASQQSEETKELIDMVKALSIQVAQLQKQQSGEPEVDAYGIIEVEEVIEPEYEVNSQIPMFNLVD